MSVVTPTIALGLFVVILIIAGILAWYMNDYASYDKGSFHTFIAILAGLGVFVTFMFYFSVIELQQQQQELATIQELARVNDSLLNSVLNEMKTASEIIPNFVLSITPLTNTVCSSNAPPDPVSPQTCTEKMVLSYRIFSVWQDVIVSDRFLTMDPISYVANFLQRANSPQLEEQWSVNKLNFSSETQEFGDLLFKYGLPITNQTPAEYISTAQTLLNDPKYLSIFNK
jgi:hypothetical protein